MSDREGIQVKAVMASTIPAKGADEFAVDTVVAWIIWLGYAVVILKSDNEPA